MPKNDINKNPRPMLEKERDTTRFSSSAFPQPKPGFCGTKMKKERILYKR
jgi:hypothetical protein